MTKIRRNLSFRKGDIFCKVQIVADQKSMDRLERSLMKDDDINHFTLTDPGDEVESVTSKN